MSGWFRQALAVAACAGALAAAGCGKNPPTRFYMLTPLPPATRAADAATGQGPVIGLYPVSLPEQLDRPEIVTLSGANMVRLAEFDQWAAPLRDSVPRVLAEDLAILVPAERVLLFPWARDVKPACEVLVDIVRFDGTLGGQSTLVADWTVSRPASKGATVSRRSSHTQPAGATYADLVSAQSQLIAALSRDIAAAIKTLP